MILSNFENVQSCYGVTFFIFGKFMMEKKILAVCLLFSSIVSANTIDDALIAGIKSHQAAKCLAYLEIAGSEDEPSYERFMGIYTQNVEIYIKNALSEEFVSEAFGSSIPLTWYSFVARNKFNRQVLSGRILEWTIEVENERLRDLYAPNGMVIPESAGEAAYNQENCILLIQ